MSKKEREKNFLIMKLSFKRLNKTCRRLKKTRLKTTQTTKKEEKEEEEEERETEKREEKTKKKKKDAAREQGSGPPETRMGEDTGRHDAR